MSLDEALLAPISAERPCGEDMAYSPEFDAIGRARHADDPTLDQGAWVTALKEADWKLVADLCTRLIGTRSKDLQLAVWLAEASANIGGLRGLGDGLILVAGLCDTYWEQVYPLPDEGDYSQRIGNLGWIAARAPQLMLEVSVAVEHIDDARVHYRQLLADTAYCAAAVDRLEQVADAHLGSDAPGFSAARSTVQDIEHRVRIAARAAGVLPDGAVNQKPAAIVAASAPAPNAGDAIQTRAQALAQLRQVAQFFRQTEPHSPVAYLADKAAAWGEQPLHVWLRGVVKDDAVFGQLEELLGAGADCRK